ncbi:TetR family transcriptional regulator [Nocardioides sp. YIM 152315]|uniref:TetR family transcriptional regulator n=1 Tax=Nocardioides sp. YIM 152315 TaxID=3031760 RepID=UPI0023DBCDFE|nr:TetR family transcriptional regulator [Nocardioides sp. YIM 152315]MDF1602116.1 TetR family transcriptional regulator [Nocardioides sp. YIM 152315]
MTGRRAHGAALGTRMRAARVARGLGLRELAQQVGMSPSSLSEFEHGKSRPGPARLAALSAALEVPVEQEAPAPVVPAFGHWREYDALPVDPVSRAGLELFVERGYHGSTVRMIAERCGMTVAGVYHHVPSKHDLLVNLMRRAMGEMIARGEAARADADGPRERLANLVESLVLFHVHRMPWAYLATNEARALEGAAATEMLEARRRMRQIFEDVVVECRGGATQPGLVPDRVTARAIVTMTISIPDWYADGGRPDPDVLAAQYVALAEDMVYP